MPIIRVWLAFQARQRSVVGNRDHTALFNRQQLLPAPQTNRERSLNDETSQAPPFFQYSSTRTSPSPANTTTITAPGQDFGFDETRSQQMDLSSWKSSPTCDRFWRDEVQKRQKHLERNRAAATRQFSLRRGSVRHRARSGSSEEEIKDLHSNLLYLKDQILMHSQCDDGAIHFFYLGHMVKQATEHGSMSSVSTKEEVARSDSPPETRAGPTRMLNRGCLAYLDLARRDVVWCWKAGH